MARDVKNQSLCRAQCTGRGVCSRKESGPTGENPAAGYTGVEGNKQSLDARGRWRPGLCLHQPPREHRALHRLQGLYLLATTWHICLEDIDSRYAAFTLRGPGIILCSMLVHLDVHVHPCRAELIDCLCAGIHSESNPLKRSGSKYTLQGEHPHRIWRLIYSQSCFADVDSLASCPEKRIFYRLISGMASLLLAAGH